MKIARVTLGDDPAYGVLEEDTQDLVILRGDPLYAPLETTGQRVALADARLLAPIIPRSKVIGIGRNYADHAAELGNEVPPEPLVFLKPNTAVVGPNDPVTLPPYSSEVDFEGELAVVISRICKDVPVSSAHQVIFGYTIANDFTARDAQRADVTWTRAKAWDSSCPLGPFIDLDFDPADAAIRTLVDGQVRQDGRTSEMVRSVPELIAYVSTLFTLLPGDVILTGTPAGVGRVEPGSRVEVEIEGIGTLSNPVFSHESSR